MGRQRRASSTPPPPPPPPPQESSTESGSDTEEEEEPPHAAEAREPPQNPRPQPPAAAAEDSDSSEEESDSDADADAHGVSHAPTKPAAAVSQPESDVDDEEEDGESSESESEVREPMQMKAAATKNSKTAKQEDKKRPAPEPAPSGREKKPKAGAGKAVPEVVPAGKGKKAKAELEKAAPEQTSSGKAKKPGGKLEKSVLDSPPPPSKSEKSKRVHRTHQIWLDADSIKILEVAAAHVKRVGALPKPDAILAAVGDRLERKDCSRKEVYEKLRQLNQRYEKTVSKGTVPIGRDTVRIYNLSEEIWGEKGKEAIAAAASQNGSFVTKSKKGQAKKEKLDGNSKVGTPKDAAATQNGDALTKLKRGKVDKDKMDLDRIPKEASTRNQNAGTGTEEETHEEETELGAYVQHTHRSFDELQNLYPTLAGCVERIEAEHPYGESLKRAFEFIGDDKADALESKIEAIGLLEVREEIYRDNLKKEVVNMLMDLKD